jgi:two-component system, sensor histidine kinase SagS
MFRTLKSSLSLSLTIIILLFIGLEYFSYQSQKVLLSGLVSNQKIAEGVVQVKTLEKDVLDLQRNILLYKINHSPTALKRFNDIMISVNNKLDVTNLFIQSNKIESDQKVALDSMRNHLQDYQENFDSVVLFINKRNDLFNEKIAPTFSLLKDIIAEELNEKTKKQPNQSRQLIYQKLNGLTSELQLTAYKYFYQTNVESINNFQNTFDKIQHETLTLNNQKISSHITALNADFTLLTQVTRNYNYLVNVVMSGSANEFLYLAKKLSETVLQHLNSSNSNLNIIVDDSILRGNIMFILGIVLTSIITLPDYP